MPLYDYECFTCHEQFEAILSSARLSEPCGEPCPSCGAMDVRKIITKSNPVDSVVINAGSKIDSGLRKTLDKMRNDVPGMKWDLGS